MSSKDKIFTRIKQLFFNKYIIVLLFFAVFISFFDQHNLLQRWETHRKIYEMEKEYQYYLNEIEKNKTEMYRLTNDDKYLEKFAREHYHMKNKNEEIFVFKDE